MWLLPVLPFKEELKAQAKFSTARIAIATRVARLLGRQFQTQNLAHREIDFTSSQEFLPESHDFPSSLSTKPIAHVHTAEPDTGKQWC